MFVCLGSYSFIEEGLLKPDHVAERRLASMETGDEELELVEAGRTAVDGQACVDSFVGVTAGNVAVVAVA